MVAGVAVAVVQRGDTLLLDGYGQANLEFDVPMPAGAVFEVGSITKQFTAAAILQLAAKDSLDLDAEITEYLPDYDTRGHTVTVRNLLYHTSGIRSYTSLSEFFDFYRREMPRDTVVSLAEDEPFRFAPGTVMSYSNTGYYLLGLIIEDVSGLSYEDYLEENLLAPAGMEASHYCDKQAVVERGAQGYTWSEDQGLRRAEAWSHYSSSYAAGALCSTAGDLVRWTRALHGGQILSETMHEEMITPGRLSDGTKLRYAMGLGRYETAGHPVIWHAGWVSGFVSDARYYPGEDLTVVVLQNTDPPQATWGLAESLARRVLGPVGNPNSHAYEGDLSKLAGRYAGPSRGEQMTLEIQAEDGHLLAIEPGSDEAPDTLNHASDLTWLGDGRYADGHYTFIRAGSRIIELHLDEVMGYYVLRRVGAN
jgi:CubicO group peptidase (beta-lactamase class C family)